jgi:hypothetical protein
MEWVILIEGLIVGFFYGKAYEKFTHCPNEVYTKDTMYKVRAGLLASGLDAEQTRLAMAFMQNRGVLFREAVKPNNVVPDDTGIGKGSIG